MHAFVVDGIQPSCRAAGRVNFVDDRIQRAAACTIFKFAREVGVPPDGFRWPDAVGEKLVALAVKNSRLCGIKFQPAIVRRKIHGDAPTHVRDAAGIPFLENLAVVHLDERGRQQRGIVLLDGKHFEAGMVGVNVRDMEAVAVNQLRVPKRLAGRAIQHGANVDQVFAAVVVHVHDANLMAPRFVRAVGWRVKPAARQLAVAIIVGHRLALEGLRGIAVFHVQQETRSHAVAIDDAEMAVHRAVGGPHIRDGGAGKFMPRHAVENGKVLRRVIGAGDGRAIRQNHAARRAHADFGFAVAIQIINRHAITVTDADGGRARLDVVLVHAVVAHVHLPKQSAVALVGLEKLVRRAQRRETIHDVIIFAVAVEIANPAKFHIVRRKLSADDRRERPGNILAHG